MVIYALMPFGLTCGGGEVHVGKYSNMWRCVALLPWTRSALSATNYLPQIGVSRQGGRLLPQHDPPCPRLFRISLTRCLWSVGGSWPCLASAVLEAVH